MQHRRQSLKAICLALAMIPASLPAVAGLEIESIYGEILQHLPNTHPVQDDSGEHYSPRKQTEVLLSLLNTLPEHTGNYSGNHTGNTVLTPYAVRDLKLLSGTALHPQHSLLHQLGPTVTVAGEIMLASQLLAPTTDISLLQQRQQALQYLVDHPALCQELEQSLNAIAGDEENLIALLNPSDFINSPGFQATEESTTLWPFNTTAATSELWRRVLEFSALHNVISLPISALAGINLGRSLGVYITSSSIAATLATGAWETGNLFMDFGRYSPSGQTVILGISLIMVVGGAYHSYHDLRSQQLFNLQVRERSSGPGRILGEADKLNTALTSHQQLTGVLTHNQQFSVLQQPQLREAFDLLAKAPEGRPGVFSYYLSSMGSYRRGLNLLKNNKDELLQLARAVGEIDAWLTMARLVRNGLARDRNPISFANLETATDSPKLHLDNVWNPLLRPETAVPNSISLGGDQPRNLLVSGPNAGGKSTAMNSVALATLLAQTFGIVPAESGTLTPFSLINTHMDISAELAAGLSSFKAESSRAIELMNHIHQLPPGQFSLVLMDEIFSSTNPTEGEAGTYSYLKTLGHIPQTINISATHYPRPLHLAASEPEQFKNMHVLATTNRGQLAYDYRLRPGPSVQHIAIQLMAEQGIQSDFLDLANDIIIHPDAYPADIGISSAEL